MLRWNTFRAQRYLRSRFNEGAYALSSEVSDVQLEMIDYTRSLVKKSLGNVAISNGWKPELYRVQLTITNVAVNVLTVTGSDVSILNVLNPGDKIFEGGVYRTTVTSVDVGLGQITVASATGLSTSDNIEVLTSNCVLINKGEAWFEGLPFVMRDGKDPLVSGSTLGAGTVIVPGGGTSFITIFDDPEGRGKVIQFSNGGSTPTADYSLVIQAQEVNITNLDDPFLKNANIPEATGQKMRLQYRIAVVPASSIDAQPIPYNSTTGSANGNLTNSIMIDYQAGSNGSVVSMTPVSGSQQIDGRDLEIAIRNNPAAGSPVGNPIPQSPAEQAEFTNGKLIDSLGQIYHLNQIITSGIEVILRIDKEVDQPDPTLSEVAPYYLVKRDVYVTDDAGSPSGKLFYRIADVSWNSTDGFVHDSVVEDLRQVIEDEAQHQETTTSKFNLSLVGGGLISAEPGVQASGVLTLTANTFVPGDEVEINGVSFIYNTDWTTGVDEDATAVSIAAAIMASTDPLIANIVTATAVNNTVEVTAVAANASGNSITTSVISGLSAMSFANANLTGGVNGITGELVWDSNFQIINPNGPTQTIPAGNAILREAGCVAYYMDLENGGTIAKGVKALTSTSNGTTISFSGTPDLSDIELGNILLVGTESTVITAIDSENLEVTVNPALSGSPGSAKVFLDTYAQGYLPKGPQMFILAVKSGTQIKVKDKSELDPGESTTSGVPTQLLAYIGATSETDSFPNYTSIAVVNDGDNLTLGISKLDEAFDNIFDFVGSTGPFDAAPNYTSTNYVTDGDSLVDSISNLDAALDATDSDVASIQAREVQNNTAKLIGGGTWHWDLLSETLTWSADAYIQIADLDNVDNTIAADTESLLNDGDVLHVEINRTAGGPALTVSSDNIAAVAAGLDTYIFARRVGNDVLIGKSFLLKDGERLELDGALAEINRKLGQLKIDSHESVASKVRISGSDILQLDGSVLSQELNNGLVDFEGAVIDFDAGDILESDDVTVIDTFTPFSVPVGEYFWYGISLSPGTVGSINEQQPLVSVFQAAGSDAVAADAPYPTIIGTKKLGLVRVHNNAGNLEIHTIRRFGVGSGSGGGSGLGVLANLYDPVSTALPTGVSATIDGVAVANGDIVLFSNLSSNNNRVYQVSGVGVSLAWTPLYVFSNNSLDPSIGETVTVKEGDSFALQVGMFDGTTYKFNDYVRYFSGVDYFEQSSLKTMTINNNDSEVVFSVSAVNNENMIVDFSVLRGTKKENGTAYIQYETSSSPTITIINGTAGGSTGVDFTVNLNVSDLELIYTSDNSGSSGVMKYSVKRWGDAAGGPGGIPNYATSSSPVGAAAGAVGDIQFHGGSGDLDADVDLKWDGSTNSINMNGLYISRKETTTLLDNTATMPFVTINAAANPYIIIEYGIVRDGDRQIGRLLVVNDTVLASITDDSTFTADPGVTFTTAISGADVLIRYTTTNTGFNATLTYSVRRWA